MQASPLPPASETSSIVDALLAFMARDSCTDQEFDALALRLHEHQYAHNEAFRRFCQGRGATPRKVRSWRDIPAVPINAFKELTLTCEPAQQAEAVFMTSGTTRGDVKGRHYHPTLAVYDDSMCRNFARRFMQGTPRLRMGILFPDETVMPNSSLAHYLALAVRHFGGEHSRYFVGAQGLDSAAFHETLRSVERSGEPFALLGASYSFVHLIDELRERGESFALPAGSRILDTGGYKGHSRELPMEEFYASLSARFGVPREQCINMYGMTELSTQFYDETMRVGQRTDVKRSSPWARVRVIDPQTDEEAQPGVPGLFRIYDLANLWSVTCIQTDDLGVREGDGFVLFGRAPGATPRGCSLNAEAMVTA